MRPSPRAIASASVLAFIAGCEAGPPRARASGDILVYDAGAEVPKGPSPYEFLAVRPVSAVGLAEARGMSGEEARAAVNRIADMLDACVTELGSRGHLGEGAARLVFTLLPDGSVAGAMLTPDPNTSAVMAIGKLCLEARVKLAPFTPGETTDGGARGMAIEAVWGKLLTK